MQKYSLTPVFKTVSKWTKKNKHGFIAKTIKESALIVRSRHQFTVRKSICYNHLFYSNHSHGETIFFCFKQNTFVLYECGLAIMSLLWMLRKNNKHFCGVPFYLAIIVDQRIHPAVYLLCLEILSQVIIVSLDMV